MIPLLASSFAVHALNVLRAMALSREGDLRESMLVRQGRGTFHVASMGHEAMAAFAPLVRGDDMVFPAYRDRALMHGLGMTTEEVALEFFARATSASGGRNLPGHFSMRRRNVFSVTSPVAAQCLPAVGAAWGFRMKGSDCAVLCHLGDAATRQGEFFEAVAQAVQDGLPVVFVVEDNGYGISTPTRGRTPLALGMLPPTVAVRVDAREPERVFEAGEAALARARAGLGPTVLWCSLDRLGNHTHADDQRQYRTAAEIDATAAGDPIERLLATLFRDGVLDEAGWESMRADIAEEVREGYLRAERAPAPTLPSAADHLYALPSLAPPRLEFPTPPTTMLQAVNGVLRAGLAADSRVVLFGEDVEDPKGGVFGITKGLSNDFPQRVTNSPLAEATIVGAAVGLAASGWRPVFELQFVDFVGPAFNQLIAQASNLRWRSKGEWSCPLVLYAPCGAYLPGGGMWHSQSNEGWFAGTPGLRVAVPSTPEDAAGLMWAALHGEDPSLVLLPKHLLRAERPAVPASPLPFGKGRVVRAGIDATIVAWGNCVEIAEAAADRLLVEDGVSVEIVDPRTLVPCDWDLIADSLARTRRLIVIQEDTETCGFGQAVVANMAIRAETFGVLKAPPALVSRADVPIPFNAALEIAILPGVADAVRAVRKSISGSPDERRDEASSAAAETTILNVPQLGEGLRRVTVTALLKRTGERVAMDEPLYEIETDKALVTVESSLAGILREWCVEVGEEIEVHAAIAHIDPDAPLFAPLPVAAPERQGYEEYPLSDRQRALNRSAQNGRLDVAMPASVRRPLSWDLVLRATEGLRGRHPRRHPTEFQALLYCVARATVDNGKFRSTLVARGETVRRYDHVDVGFAISLPDDELTTAVVRNADELDFEAFQKAVRLAHRAAKAGDTVADARTTLLVSSLAGHDVVDASPVLFPPAIATLFVGSPFAGTSGQEVSVTLAFDHRLINGVGAARFLQRIEQELTELDSTP